MPEPARGAGALTYVREKEGREGGGFQGDAAAIWRLNETSKKSGEGETRIGLTVHTAKAKGGGGGWQLDEGTEVI